MAIKEYRTKMGEVRFQASLWKNNQLIKSKTFHRKIDAKDWIKLEESKSLNLSLGRVADPQITLNDFFYDVYWKHKKIRASTALEYKSVFNKFVEPFLGKRRLSTITTADCSEFVFNLVSGGMSESRANRVHATISGILANAVKLKYAQFNPMSGIGYFQEPIQKVKSWTFKELEVFLNYTHQVDHKFHALFHFSYQTGLRISEIIALKWDCVDLDNDQITVMRTWSGKSKEFSDLTKSGKQRFIGVNSGLKSLLLKLKIKSKSEFVFSNEEGNHYLYEHIRDHFKRLLIKLNLKNIGVHGLRHTYASHFIMNGGSIYELKTVLGHSDIATTEKYAHLSSEHLKKQAQLVSFQAVKENNVLSLIK